MEFQISDLLPMVIYATVSKFANVFQYLSEYLLFIHFVVILVDVTVYHRGYHGDLNETFFIGEVGEVGKKLVQTTWDCLQKAIEAGKLSTYFEGFPL